MITGEIKSRIDRIWDTMWSGGISNPLSVIEQLTYLLFIKRLDELHTLKERKAARLGKPLEDPIFASGQEHLRWSRFKEAAPEQMFAVVRDEVFPFIKGLGRNGSDGNGSTYSRHVFCKREIPKGRCGCFLGLLCGQVQAPPVLQRTLRTQRYLYSLFIVPV